MTIFKLTSNRMCLYPPHLQRDIDPATLERTRSTSATPERWKGKRSGVEMPRMDATIELESNNSFKRNNMGGIHPRRKFADVTDYLMSKVLTPEKLRRPDQMVHIMNALGASGEVLYILRPLLYGKDINNMLDGKLKGVISACCSQIWTLVLETMVTLLGH